MLYAIFAILVIILDQGVKLMVSDVIHMESGGEAFISGIVSIVNVHNDGAAFSFLAGSGARIFFIVLTGVFTVAVIIALATKFISGPLARWSIVMVTAGGISNCIDRVLYGYVLDMFKLEFVNFPIFNVADIFITVFAILFVLAIIFERDRRSEDDFLDDEFDEDDEDDYDDEEEDEEDEKPRRLSRKEKRALRRSKRYEDEDEEDEEEDEEDEEEDEEEEEPAPRSRRKQRAAVRRSVREEEDEEDEEEAPVELPKPRRTAQRQSQPEEKTASNREYYPPRTTTTHTTKYGAELDQVLARRAAAQKQAAAAKPAVPAEPAPEPIVEARPVSRPAAPAPAPKPAPVSEEFSLDDILAEFK